MNCEYPRLPKHAPKRTEPPENIVILLGAGASAPVGLPLIRGFMDRGRDLLRRPIRSSDGQIIEEALEVYDDYRKRFLITEVDLDNIEELMSIVDLGRIAGIESENSAHRYEAERLRRLIDVVVSRSTGLPDTSSPEWLVPGEKVQPYVDMLTASYACPGKVTIVSLNYDCVIEYCLHCLGVPFTYNANAAVGIPILKLHGSVNWFQCLNKDCPRSNDVQIVPLRHYSRDPGMVPTVASVRSPCAICTSRFDPLIVPPSWTKRYDSPALIRAWRAARLALSNADVLIALGYSLPLADVAVRNLLHASFANGKLGEAFVSIGDDPQAAERWTNVFRPSWARNRLTISQSDWRREVNRSVCPLLGVQEIRNWQQIPPVPRTQHEIELRKDIGLQMRKLLHDRGTPLNCEPWELRWSETLARIRQGSDDSDYARVATEVNLTWTPNEQVVPAEWSP